MKRQKIKMIDTGHPDVIPNGTIGYVMDPITILNNGLIETKFKNYKVYVYPHEIEFIKEPEKRKGETMENYRPYDNEELEMCVGHVYIYNGKSRHVVTDYINGRIYMESKPVDPIYFLNHFTTVIGMPCGVKI